MSAQLIHVACSTDARGAPDCAVMLASLLATNEPASLHVHLLHDDSLCRPALDTLRTMVEASGASFDSLDVPRDRRSAWPATDKYPVNAWYRFRLSELRPELARVIYLDTDVLVRSPLEHLWRLELAGLPVAAVTNYLYPRMIGRIESKLGVPRERYFNSGVLLVDLEGWRERGIADEIDDFVRTRALVWPDQDALNGVLHARCLRLHPRWNAMPGIWNMPPRHLPYSAQEVREARQDPAIVHFINGWKPWHYRCTVPYRHEWFRLLERTTWPRRELEGRSPAQILLKRLPAVWAYNIEASLWEWRRAAREQAARVRCRVSASFIGR